MREIGKLAVKLLIIAAAAGLLLGLVNALTQGPIAEQQIKAANAARSYVITGSEEGDHTLSFQLICEDANGVDNAYRAERNGEIAGYTAQVTTKGYGGEIEVTVGVDASGTITGVSVGGSNFSETAGLGARTKESAFTSQFTGKIGPFAVTQDGGAVDAVSGATISSRAVANAVNDAWTYLSSLIGEGGNHATR